MESYLTLILTFIGGGLGVAVLQWLIGRGKARLEMQGMKDDQTIKWRDDALHISEQMMDKNDEINQLNKKLHDCLQEQEDCNCK